MPDNAHIPDREFVHQLRAAVDAYLAAVDQWEAAFQKHYRLPGVSADMEAEQRVYDARRRELEAFVPRARRMCLGLDLREPFSGLLRVSLGTFAPQVRADSAIGRGERNTVAVCLMELEAAASEWPEAPKPRRKSLLDFVLDFFG